MSWWGSEHVWFSGRQSDRLEHWTRGFTGVQFLPLRLFLILPAVDPSRIVLVQMGVGVQLERQIGDINLNEGQLSVQRGMLRLTQQEDHRHTVAHLQDGCFLAVNIDRGYEIISVRASVLVCAEGEMVHWCTRLMTAYEAREFWSHLPGVEPHRQISTVGRIEVVLRLRGTSEPDCRIRRRTFSPELNHCSFQRNPPANVHSPKTSTEASFIRGRD